MTATAKQGDMLRGVILPMQPFAAGLYLERNC